MVTKHEVLDQIPTGYDNRVNSRGIAERIDEQYRDADDDPVKPTNVRDTVQELIKEGFAIGGGQGLGGYWLIDSPDGLQRVLENIESNIETQEERKRLILEACETPPVTYEEPDGPREPDIPETLRDAVDALVEERGVRGAEKYLQERFRSGDDQDRALGGLSYLRAHYGSGQSEVIAGP